MTHLTRSNAGGMNKCVFRPISRFVPEIVPDRSWKYSCNGRLIVSRLWSVEWRHFQWPRTTPNSDFKVTPLFDAECLRNGTRYRHSYNGMLIWTYALYSGCHFEWPWVILSDLAKYLMTRSIARSLGNSWASGYSERRTNKKAITGSKPLIRL